MIQAAIATASAFAADAKAVAVVFFNGQLQMSYFTFVIYKNTKHYTELSIAAMIQAANAAASAFAADGKADAVVIFNILLQLSYFAFAIYENSIAAA